MTEAAEVKKEGRPVEQAAAHETPADPEGQSDGTDPLVIAMAETVLELQKEVQALQDEMRELRRKIDQDPRKPAATNDTAAAAEAEVALVLGQQTEDGVYAGLTADGIDAGLTADGKQQIFAMPTDLNVTMTFNDAAKAVEKLNADKALGHNDWQIGSLDVMRILQKNQNEGSLKGTFKTAFSRDASDFPTWYWSSMKGRNLPSGVRIVRFSDGGENWGHKDGGRLSCRPVRLLPVAAPSLG